MNGNKREIKMNIEIQSSVEINNNLESNKETNSLAGGDIDGIKIIESREERIKRLKDRSEAERQRRYNELIISQKQSFELRQKQQEDRRKKIEKLKEREEERKKKVEQRRSEMEAKDKEKNESFLKRTKEREARAALSQKQLRMSNMIQSTVSIKPNRMTSSTIHYTDKCSKVYSRSFSGGEIDLILKCDKKAAVASKIKSDNTIRRSTEKKRQQVPDGFIEVDGNLIPAKTRHAGCFIPLKQEPLHRVKGVLSWGRPSDKSTVIKTDRGSSVSWWAAIGEPKQRAVSAHASLISSRGGGSCRNHLSTPSQNLQQIDQKSSQKLENTNHTERSTPDIIQKLKRTFSVKIIKAMSQRLVESNTESSNQNSGRISLSPRPQNRSSSRPTETTGVQRKPVSNLSLSISQDQGVYDHTAKFRSLSQPSKNKIKNTQNSSPMKMSSSFTKQSPKNSIKTKVKNTNATVTLTDKKPNFHRKKYGSISDPDSGLTTSPVSEMEPIRDTDTPEVITVADNHLTENKTISPMKFNKSPQNRENETIEILDKTSERKTTPNLTEEEIYRLKLTEQRRLAREAKEKKQEEQKRIEEEAKIKSIAEKKKMEEETREILEENIRRIKQMKDEEEIEIENQKKVEEMERSKKEALEMEFKKKSLEKLLLEDSDRVERKRRLEKIMSRVKKPDNVVNNEENATDKSEIMNISVKIENESLEEITSEKKDIVLEELSCEKYPTEVWINERTKYDQNTSKEKVEFDIGVKDVDISEKISENVLNSSGFNNNDMKQTNMESVDKSLPENNDQIPQFKSRLLQSMLASGKLANTDGKRNSLKNSSNLSLTGSESMDKRQSLVHNISESVPHSRSYNCGISQMSTSMNACDQSRFSIDTNDNTDNLLQQDCVTTLRGSSSCSTFLLDEGSSAVAVIPLELS